MVVSMALAALLLSFGFWVATSYFAGEAAKSRDYDTLAIVAWIAMGGLSLGFAFLAGSLWP